MNVRNNYEQNLLQSASTLDKILNAQGHIVQLALSIIQTPKDKDTFKLCSIIGQVADKGDRAITQQAKELKDALVNLYGSRRLKEVLQSQKKEETAVEEQTLEELITELNSLVGLSKVKSKVNDLVDYQKVQHLRKEIGLSVPKNTLHLAFTGNPGTGKTTVARIVGRIYKHIGLLSKGHFLEVSRTDLIAGYQGQTALKVKEIIEKAKGGVLFIDEAYSITENDHSDSYGRECLTELTKALEDYRSDLVVIVAGYTEPMHKFFESNPGLKSRFNTFIEFDDYNSEELMDILQGMCAKEDYVINSSAQEKLHLLFSEVLSKKTEQFANGRFIRNIFEDMVMNHARRLSRTVCPTKKELQELIDTDTPIWLSQETI
ncbi:hypothetical protein IX335_000825 [Porphyromonas levii]|uniref:AAA family ATPase n=1 Tax=Porphyromonas levii TaxID=28114 RepID=UPI001BAB485B|nr:AAA family ATPase [Porphyromonas levii]MBR8763610.1 hypothetical protein [Porphyromonas levii]